MGFVVQWLGAHDYIGQERGPRVVVCHANVYCARLLLLSITDTHVLRRRGSCSFIRRHWVACPGDSFAVSEIYKLLIQMNVKLPKSQVKQCLDKVDVNRNGKLDLDEFVTLVRMLRARSEVERLYNAYASVGNPPEMSLLDFHSFLQSSQYVCRVPDALRVQRDC
jgi:hypothetical protein